MPTSGMPRKGGERHHSSDEFYTYSDDDSGSLNDSYFLTPTSPTPAAETSGRSRRQTEPAYQTRLQPLSEGGDVLHFSGDEGDSNGLARHTQATYGSIVNELSQQAPPELPIPDKKLARRLRRKQLEHIAREKAVYEVRGKQQDKKCRDTGWAVLFVVQLLLVVFSALKFGSGVVLSDNNSSKMVKSMGVLEITDSSKGVDSTAFTNVNDVLEQLQEFDLTEDVSERLATSLFTIDYQNVINLCWITGFYACILSILTVSFMLIIAKSLIQTTLVFSIAMSLAWGWIGLSVPGSHFMIPVMGFIAFFLTVGYTFLKWDRIPFAATNLNTALAAMRCTADIALVGMGMLMLAFAWNVVWSTAFIGIVDTINTRDCGSIDDDDTVCTEEATSSHLALYIMLFLSFLWTNLVIKNIVQVTVASAVGTWWFQPDEISPCCTKAVTSPLIRCFTTSLGSICLGSLLVVPCQFLGRITNLLCAPCKKYLSCRSQGKRSDQKWLCRFLEAIVHFNQCCNRWSFTYIGMYQYDFVDAGEKALKLFETREWIEVVSDNLIHNVLLIVSIVMGGSTGTFGVLVEEVDGYTFSSFHKPIITAFFIGSVLGFVLSSILLVGVIGSAFDTVLVCFAAGPFEFHQNHPYLSQEMRDSWSQQVWEDSPV